MENVEQKEKPCTSYTYAYFIENKTGRSKAKINVDGLKHNLKYDIHTSF